MLDRMVKPLGRGRGGKGWSVKISKNRISTLQNTQWFSHDPALKKRPISLTILRDKKLSRTKWRLKYANIEFNYYDSQCELWTKLLKLRLRKSEKNKTTYKGRSSRNFDKSSLFSSPQGLFFSSDLMTDQHMKKKRKKL